MPHLPLTYTLAVAPCLTFGGRTAEAVGGTADGFGGGRDEAHSSLFTFHSSLFTPPYRP